MGPTGKLQRRSLAEQFGLTGPGQDQSALRTAYTAPRTPLEEVLAGLWAVVLGAHACRHQRQLLPVRRRFPSGHPTPVTHT